MTWLTSPWLIVPLILVLVCVPGYIQAGRWPFQRRCSRCHALEKGYHALEHFRGWSHNRRSIRCTRREHFCRPCLIAAFAEKFKVFPHRAVVVTPFPTCQGYLFYALSVMPLLNYPADEAQIIQDLLPPEGHCVRCSHPATMRLVDDSIYKDAKNPASGFKTPNADSELICATCASSIVAHGLEKNRTDWLVLSSPEAAHSSEGIWTSYEA